MEENLPALVEDLKEQLKNDVKCLRNDYEFLAKFLRIRDYDVTRAAIAVRNYYNYVEVNYDRLHGIKPSDLLPVYNSKITTFLKERSKIESKVILIRVKAWDPHQWPIPKLQQAHALAVEQILQDKQTQIKGVSIIIDFDGLSFSHVGAITPKEMKRFLTSVQNGFPVKIAAIHLINYPRLFWGIYYLAQRFLKEKLRKRIHFHSNLESLHEEFNKETLPDFLGGLLELDEAIDQDAFNRLMSTDCEYDEYYKPKKVETDSDKPATAAGSSCS